jgi:hypothetical protein
MLREYKVVALDHLVSGDIPQAYRDDPAIMSALARVSYRPLLRNWRQQRDDTLFCLDDSYNRRLADSYWDMAGQAHAIAPCGELHFDHIWCLGQDGLRVDIENSVVFIGHSVNWGREYFNWWIDYSQVGFVDWVSADVFRADFGDPDHRDDNVVMMKYPGYGIFGHWLLDFIPQLAVSRYMGLPEGTKFVFDHLTDWMKGLLDAAGTSSVDCYRHRLTEHANLRMPTGMKNGYALGQPINALAWSGLRAHFNHLNCERAPTGMDRLFISRRKWAGQRGLADYDALENLMTSLGFIIFHPEQHSLQDQAHYFSQAKVILGEDGSGLHTIMLSDPGAVLGVLMHDDRHNLWHAGICHTMGHRVAYHELRQGPEGVVIDIDAIRTFANAIVDQPQR